MSEASDPDLARLISAAHHAAKGIGPGVQAVELYRAAALAAERVIPAPLGIAVAGVLALAAEQRRASRFPGTLGEPFTTLALAAAVLALDES